jgi:hypothetical protein
MPNNLVWVILQINLSSWPIIKSIVLFVVKCIKYVLLKFKESRFILRHLFKIVKVLRTLILKSIKPVCATKMLVSSANFMGFGLSFIILGRSFMHMRESRGPKSEPCRTPHNNLDQHETL